MAEIDKFGPILLPNDKFDGGTVVASCYTGEAYETAVYLILLPTSPYFRVVAGEYVNGGWAVNFRLGFENIVPAVREYKNQGGDY